MALNIWSNLLKSSKTSEVYCPDELDINVTLEDFYEAYKRKLAENRVDADVELGDVSWDDGKVVQKRIIATYKGNDPIKTNNIQRFLLGLDKVGSFTYIEEKVFLNRPALPKFPRSKMSEPANPGVYGPSLKLLGAAVVALIFAFIFIKVAAMALILFAVAAGTGWAWYNGKKKYDAAMAEYNEQRNEVRTNNDEADAEQRAWDKAWDDWEKNVLNTAYLASTNDIFGRFVRALSSSVELTRKELFDDRRAELKERREQEVRQQELSDFMKKTRQEGFK